MSTLRPDEKDHRIALLLAKVKEMEAERDRLAAELAVLQQRLDTAHKTAHELIVTALPGIDPLRYAALEGRLTNALAAKDAELAEARAHYVNETKRCEDVIEMRRRTEEELVSLRSELAEARRERDTKWREAWRLFKAAQEDGCNWPGVWQNCETGPDCTCRQFRELLNPAPAKPERAE